MITKTYLKTKPECKVKFVLPAALVGKVKKVSVVGDFNDWDSSANALRKQKSGDYSTSFNLKVDQSYQFRYLIDGTNWINDDTADGYEQSPVSQESNSVIHI